MANEQDKQSALSTLLTAVQAQIESGTFSMEAVKRIEDLRQGFVALELKVETLTIERNDYKGRLEATQRDLETLRRDAGDLTKREAVVKAAEIQIAVDKKELELTKAHKDDMKGLLQTALRSPIVQKTMSDTIAVPGGPGAPGFTTPVARTETRQEV